MKVPVNFYSYFKDLTGCPATEIELPEGANITALLASAHEQFPKLKDTARSTLVAVGVDYQPHDYVLQAGDVVSLFPPVQGG